MNHVDEMACLLYLEGQLEREQALELSAHTVACGECRALLRALERESHLLAHALVEDDEAVPARLLAPPARDTTPWAWIISFGLAAAGSYTLWTGVIEPWQQQLSRAGFGGDSLLALLFFRGAFWKGWGDMANAIQFLAVGTLGLLAVFLLRRTWRRWTSIAMVMSVLTALLMMPSAAGAAEVKKGSHTYTLPAGETIKNDLIVTTGTARIDGTVDGDLIVFCQSLTINGRVTGDVIAFSQFLRINGPVDGNVRAFANTATITSTVAKNVTAFVQHLELDPKAQVGGGALLFAGEANLEGRIARDLMAFAAHPELNGFVGGDAKIKGERLVIGPTAEILGKTKFSGSRNPEVAPTAKLASPIEVEIIHRRPDYAKPGFYWKQALAWGAAFIYGLVLILVAGGFFADVVRSGDRYGPAFGFGALILFATPIVAIIACVTLVGLAVGICTLLLWIIALYSSQVFVGTWLGDRILGTAEKRGVPITVGVTVGGSVWPRGGSGAMIGRLALGLVLVRIAVALPYIGGWIKLAVILWGLGALTLALYRRSQPPAAAEIPPAPLPAVPA